MSTRDRPARSARPPMTASEIDAFLGQERVCRIGTSGPAGPAVTALWFYWDGADVWINSLAASRRSADLRSDARVALIVDAGSDLHDIRGVSIRGRAEFVGPAEAISEAVAAPARLSFHRKYRDPEGSPPADPSHDFIRITVSSLASWDFRLLNTL